MKQVRPFWWKRSAARCSFVCFQTDGDLSLLRFCSNRQTGAIVILCRPSNIVSAVWEWAITNCPSCPRSLFDVFLWPHPRCLKQAEDKCLASGPDVKQSGLRPNWILNSLCPFPFVEFQIYSEYSDQITVLGRAPSLSKSERSLLQDSEWARKCFSQINITSLLACRRLLLIFTCSLAKVFGNFRSFRFPCHTSGVQALDDQTLLFLKTSLMLLFGCLALESPNSDEGALVKTKTSIWI